MKCVHNFAHPMSTCSHCISAGAPRFPPDRRRSPSQSSSTPLQTSPAPAAERPAKPLPEAKAAAPTLSRGPTLPAHLPADVGLGRAPAAPSSNAPSQSPSKPLQSSSSSTPRAPVTCGACGLPMKGHTPAKCAEAQAEAKRTLIAGAVFGSITRPCARCPNVNTRRPDSPLPDFCKSCHGNATKRARIALGRHEVTDAEVLAELAKPYDPEAARRLPGTSKARKARAEAMATRPKATPVPAALVVSDAPPTLLCVRALASEAPTVLAAPDAPTRDGGRLVLVEVPAPPTTDAQAESVTPACAPEPPAGNAERTAPDVTDEWGWDSDGGLPVTGRTGRIMVPPEQIQGGAKLRIDLLDRVEQLTREVAELRERIEAKTPERPPIATPEPPPRASGAEVTPELVSWLQELPEPTALVQQLVAGVEARSAFGREKYGQPLMTGDGRDSVNDAAQEGYDLLQYAYKASMNGEPVDRLVPLLRVGLRLCGGPLTVYVDLPEVVLGMLDTLLVTGLWGTTRAAALERLACERLRDLTRDGILVLK